MSKELVNDRSLVSEGRHHVMLDGGVEHEGKKGPYWEYVATLIGSDDPDAGKTLPLRLSLNPGARWKVVEFLDAVQAPETGRSEIEDYNGRVIDVEVIQTEYKEQRRAEIDKMFPSTMPPEEIPTASSGDDIPF